MDPLSTAAGALAAGALLLAWDRSSSAPEPWLIAACGLILATASWGAWRLARLGSDGTLSVAPPALVPAAAASRCEDSIARCLLHSRRGILEANDSFRRLLGYGPGQGWDERGMEFHLQRDWWQGFERAALSDGVVQGRFTEVVTLTGVSLTLDVSARVLERDHGFWLMEILLREPSASDAVSLSRRQEQERYTRLIHNLQEVLFEVDPHGRFEFLNPSWKTLVGREADESLGLSMAEFAAQEDREEVGSLLLQLRERRQDFFYRDLRFLRHPRGEERWAACFIKVRLDARGEVQGMTGTLTDITERKELELSLRGAREEAESAITAKDDFLAVISHEIRTPMNAVLGLTYLLLETTLNAEQKDLATTIQTSGQTLLALLNDLLDFSRIESGSLRLDTSDFAIRELIQRSMHLLSARAQEKKLALDLSIAEGVPGSVSGDAARFQQVMLNLVGNAIKFTDRGVVTVRAYRAEIPFDPPTARAVVLQAPPPSPSPGPWLCVSVADTGIGLKPEQQKGMFQKFSQGDSSATRRFGGMGMGLAISKALVELMGGHIGFSSQFGSGSVFWFAVPIPAGKDAAVASHTEAERRQERARASLLPAVDLVVAPGLRVLIAEDNPTNARLIEGLLQKRGFVTETVRNGRAAVERALATSFDLVLMDCDMPEMDGISATVAIRHAESARSGGRRVPVIALTANAMNSDREKCLACGMDDFLTKPLNVKALERTLSQWLKSSADSGPGARSF